MNDCVFCKIVEKQIPASIAHEDEEILVFMTINAVNPGHSLVIPKKHIDNAFDLDDETYTKLQLQVKKVAKAIHRAFNPIRVGMMVSGMEVPHAHFHVIPINDSDDITSKKTIDGTSLKLDQQTLDEYAKKIKYLLESNT